MRFYNQILRIHSRALINERPSLCLPVTILVTSDNDLIRSDVMSFFANIDTELNGTHNNMEGLCRTSVFGASLPRYLRERIGTGCRLGGDPIPKH